MRTKTNTRLLASLAAVAATMAALAPAASAELRFAQPPVIKAHSPQKFPDPFVTGPYQGAYLGFIQPTAVSDYNQQVTDLSELTQAGAHPDFTTRYVFGVFDGSHVLEGGHPRTVVVDAPPGAVGNPRAVPRCSASDFNLTVYGACPSASQVGESLTAVSELTFLSPISSIVPTPGVTATLGFKALVVTAVLNPVVRSDGDYGLRVAGDELPIPLLDYTGSTVTLWGVPHDPVHDPHRVDSNGFLGGSVGGTPRPFLSAPTNCSSGPLDNVLRARSWEDPDTWIEATITAAEPTGCEQIRFEPALSAEPTTTVADAPTGLEVDLHTPQTDRCDEIVPAPVNNPSDREPDPFYECDLSTSHLKDTTVNLPEGLVINPSGANGLDGCSAEEAGLTSPLGQVPLRFDGEPASCPDASKIGTVEVDTPLLDNPMQGAVFLADPYDNPFESFLALYISVNDPSSGIVATLAGEVQADPQTGRLTSTFLENPQLPFEHFFLHFKRGPHAPLRTPACGDYATTGSLTPYADPDSPVATNNPWSITEGCGQPNAPSFDAGVVSPIAGAHSPFVMHLRREDGSQQFSAVTVSPPQGLTAKLAGVPACSEADLATAAAKSGAGEKASPSCPASSEVGNVTAGAGAGPSPYYAPGKVYMAGPYKGAPLSFAIVTPATAGPFDLGTVVIRTALHVDPTTAKITAVSDPIPSILQGIPLDVRTVDLSLDRDQFTLTGTSCDPSAVEGQLTSLLGQVAQLSSRYQLGECSSLGFKPRMALRLKGGTARGKHPQLTAFLLPRPGDANIRSVSVAFPRSEFLENAHIRTICTRPDFAADRCPAGAVYGTSTVITPLLDYPLTGNVYLRSSDNLLPDVVPDLRGPAHQPIRVEAAGRTDSIRGGIRNTFDFFPDAPFTRAILRMRGGDKGLLVNSRNICARTYRAVVRFTAHNGKTRTIRPKLVSRNCKRKKAKRGGHSRGSQIAHRSAVR